MNMSRLFRLAVVCALALAACSRETKTPSTITSPSETSAPAVPAAPQKYTYPNYPIEKVEMKIRDESRNGRVIPLVIRYPIGAQEPLPVILFSHGGGPDKDGSPGYVQWGETFAHAGYVTINISHMENLDVTYDDHCVPLGIPADECEKEDFNAEVAEGGTIGILWYDRPRDASAVVNQLAGVEQRIGLDVDENRIGIAGHSGGAHTVMSLAGAAVDVSPSVHNVTYTDSRVRAYLALSPLGVGRLGFTENSWSNISVPVMIQTGQSDGTLNETPESRLDPFKGLPGPDHYLLYIDAPSATHATFGMNFDTPIENFSEDIVPAALAFFECYLSGADSACAWLMNPLFENPEVSLEVK